jgi:hypothetical protein
VSLESRYYHRRINKKYGRDIPPLKLYISNEYGSILCQNRPEFHCDSFHLMDGDGKNPVIVGVQDSASTLNEHVYELSYANDSVCYPYYLDYRYLEYEVEERSKMENEKKDHFKVSKVSKLADLKEGDNLNKSDLAIQVEDKLIQFEFIKDEDRKKQKTIIKPGTFTFIATQTGIKLDAVSIAKKRLLLDVSNTATIVEEANCFFSNLDVYRELERPLKRGVGCSAGAPASLRRTHSLIRDPSRQLLHHQLRLRAGVPVAHSNARSVLHRRWEEGAGAGFGGGVQA